MTLVPTISASSISSLMVGVMTKDDTSPPKLTVKHCQSSTLSSSSSTSSSASEEVDSKDDNRIEEFRRMIRRAWLEKSPIVAGAVTTTSSGGTKEDEEPSANQLLEKMLNDEAQLDRILIARKYEMDACLSLFFEQFRFRAKWKPQSIQPEDIPNALPCK